MAETNTDNSHLLTQFQSFCGSEQYARFLLVTNTRAIYKGRLLHWQDKLWRDFCDQYPEYSHLEQANLLKLFRICHIHDHPMLDDEVPAIYGYWHFPQDYLNAREQLFPLANMMHCGDSVELQQPASRQVQYCPACRDALIAWNADRTQKVGIQ